MSDASPMHHFRTVLMNGKKRPYDSWTFVIIPPRIASSWGPGQKAVRGTIAGCAFRGFASRGEGALRVPISREFLAAAEIGRGDKVEVELQLDEAPPPVRIPNELMNVFRNDPEVGVLYEKLPPSYKRAWATYVAEAKRPETRVRRAGQAPDGIRARAFPR